MKDYKLIYDRLKEQFGKDYMTTDEFSKFIGIDKSRIYEGVKARTLPAVRISERIIRFPLDKVALWIAKSN
jgi:excisionase family DNA binding protein